MTRQQRLKLLDKKGELRQELDMHLTYGTYSNPLAEWIEGVIPPVPPGTYCEAKRCITQTTCGEEENGHYCVHKFNHESDEEHNHLFLGHYQERPFAETYMWVIKDGHVCFTYICWECGESMEGEWDEDAVAGYPTTKAGYAIAPRHCESPIA